MAETVINDLPDKTHAQIFQYLSQTERQLNRTVCTKWNQIINEDFPVKITISNENNERMFKCVNAKNVVLNGLTEEYHGEIGFKESVNVLEITGKVLSSNVLRLLNECQQLTSLTINSPKEVLGIQNNDPFGLVKLTSLEFKVRMDQETFTSDEFILINSLRNAKLGSLVRNKLFPEFTQLMHGSRPIVKEHVSVSVKEFEIWEDDEVSEESIPEESVNDSEDYRSNVSESNQFVAARIPIYPSSDEDVGTTESGYTTIVSRDMRETSESLQVPLVEVNLSELGNIVPEEQVESNNFETSAVEDDSLPHQEHLHVDVSVGMTQASSRDTTYSRIGVEFASRLFNARMRLWSRNSAEDLETYLNDPTTRERMGYFENPFVNQAGISSNVAIKSTAFSEILINNFRNLKNFIVKARPDFLCFGNLSSFTKSKIANIQFEDVEYSFGRSQKLCSEYLLLEVQSKLKRLRLNILDDMWSSVMKAVDKSSATFSELDVKILSLSEEPIDLLSLSKCRNLKILKLFHFFDKQNLQLLPSSLSKLILNGPVAKGDIQTFATRLDNLQEFTLILNFNPTEKIDAPLFKKLAAMPKIRKLVFIQTQIDVDGVSEYCENTPGVTIAVQGPRELKEPYTLTYAIQCIAVNISSNASRTQ